MLTIEYQIKKDWLYFDHNGYKIAFKAKEMQLRPKKHVFVQLYTSKTSSKRTHDIYLKKKYSTYFFALRANLWAFTVNF